MYTMYCANQPNAMIKLQEYSKKSDFTQTLKVMISYCTFLTCRQICESDPRCRGLKLSSFLIKPIQRICKYPLLFRELLKFTNPDEHTRYSLLIDAFHKIEKVTEHINEGKRTAEKLQRIVDIQYSIDSKEQLVRMCYLTSRLTSF